MKIQKLRWLAVRDRVLSEVPESLKHRVKMPKEGEGFLVEIEGKELLRVYAHPDGVAIENRASFRFGSDKRGHQMEDLQSELRDEVFRSLGLQRGHCGNWGYADGSRIDGNGRLQRSPLQELMDAMEDIERSEAEAASTT